MSGKLLFQVICLKAKEKRNRLKPKWAVSGIIPQMPFGEMKRVVPVEDFTDVSSDIKISKIIVRIYATI